MAKQNQTNAEPFVVGQRWICETELQLGLGTVVQVEMRTVTIYFAASEENRIYAQQTAPLTRVTFAIGDTISDGEGKKYTVSDTLDQKGLLIYQATDGVGNVVVLPETALGFAIQLNRPVDRLFSGQVDSKRWFEMRYNTWQHQQQWQNSPMRGLLGGRTSPIPHQLYIAYEVANRYAPRVLLADEVGLGKTIEAGMIVHQQLLTGRAQRVLIVVPEPLLHQWIVEMLRRFNLHFSLLDEERCLSLSESNDGANPFQCQQLNLCSLEFLVGNSSRFQQAADGEWDLLVVDEAHHLQWNDTEPSVEYRVVEVLAAKTKGVLLLTATPEQFGRESHFSRLRLLDPDRFQSYQSYIEEENGYQPIAVAVEQLLTGQPLSEEISKFIRETAVEGDNLTYLQHITAESEQAPEARQRLIEHLLDRHGTGRVLFRNSRSAIEGFPQRQVSFYPLAMPEIYQQINNDWQAAIAFEDISLADYKVLQPLLQPEIGYQRSPLATKPWTEVDPRVEWLHGFLQQYQGAKVLVITALAESAIDLARTLTQRYGISAAAFHEKLTLMERDRAAAYFANREEGCQVLICSEVGSEGRNFQFAHQLVLFDLPFNPDLLEQRIGRLDRIGQTRTIEIAVPYMQGGLQQLLSDWYHQGGNAFEQTSSTGQALLQQMWPQFIAAISNNHLDQEILSVAREKHQQLVATLQQGRNRLLEYNSCRSATALQLLQLAETEQRSKELTHWLDQLFDAIGIDSEPASAFSTIIRPTEQLQSEYFPWLDEDGLTMTSHRPTALANEDMHYMTWEHPMVVGAMDRVISGEKGNCSLVSMQYPGLKPGSLLLESVYCLDLSGLHGDIERYCPPFTVRVVVDANGNDLSALIDFEAVSSNSHIVKRTVAREIIKSYTDAIKQLLNYAQLHIDALLPEKLDAAKQRAENLLQREIHRLQALARLHNNVRVEELRYFQQQFELVEQILQNASMQLDAVRVIVTT